MDKLFEFINTYKIMIAVGVVLLVLIGFIIVRTSKKRGLQRRFDELEVQYNELVSIPVLFKINKANGLAKMNPNVEGNVIACKASFDDLRKEQDEIARVLADTEDAIAFNKQKEARYLLDDLYELLKSSLDHTHQLSNDLDRLLEQETQQRSEITGIKERFRDLKTQAQNQAPVLGDGYESFEVRFQDIEHNFSQFEEWMYASDFVQAQEISGVIRKNIEILEQDLERVPHLNELAKGYLPNLLGEVSKQFQEARSDNVYVEHLEVTRNIGVMSEVLKEDLLKLRQGEFIDVEESLENNVKRLEQLNTEINKEVAADKELNQRKANAFEVVDTLHDTIKDLVANREKIKTRFDFEGFDEMLDSFNERIATYQQTKQRLVKMIEQEHLPASTILVSLKELDQDVKLFNRDFKTLNDKIEQANADETRAENQLLKLYLIMNDVQVRIKTRNIPSISEKYHHDLVQAYDYTDQIKNLLDHEVLDVPLLNATVEEAIDYIYKLHNNINNLVGVVDMCENAFVFANRYRAYVSDIDAELTRAELAFNNGEYTQSLSMVINAIDTYRPNEAYEELIRNNAQSSQ